MTEKMKKWNRIMDYYRDGAYGEEHLTIAQILERAGEPNLIDEMNIEDLSELFTSFSSGPLKAWISRTKDEKVIQKKSSECLLLLDGHSLEVWKIGDFIRVTYEDSVLSPEPGCYFGTEEYGEGKTFEEACHDYLRKIEGKTIQFRTGKRHKEDVFIMPVHK